jgi:hypothetical protein
MFVLMRQHASYPARATPWLTLADNENATRGKSMVKMQPWSGGLRG